MTSLKIRRPENLTTFAEVQERKRRRMGEILRARVDSFSEHTLLHRQHAVIRWALRKSHEVLAGKLASAMVLASTYRRMYKVAVLDLEELRQSKLRLIEEVEYYKGKVIKTAVEKIQGGRAKARNDPKYKAMRKARRFFDEWADGKHRSIRTNDQFAMECLRRFPELQSVSYISKNRVPAWRKARGQQK